MNVIRKRSFSSVLAASNRKGRHGERFCNRGFTLIELLALIATIALLAITVLPALAVSKADTRAGQCMANTRQMTSGWLMYAGDNRGSLMVSGSGVNGWVQGAVDWTSNSNNTNTTLLVGPRPAGEPAPTMGFYLRDPRVFKDPADNYQSAANPGPQVRSYSMNGALGPGAGPTVAGTAPDGRKYYGSDPNRLGVGRNASEMSDLLRPSLVYVILDEHADSINDGKFMFNPGGGATQPGPEKWRDLPASYHDKAGCISFADGHSIIHRWQDPRTVWPVAYKNYVISPWGSLNLGVSADYKWMDDHMPYR